MNQARIAGVILSATWLAAIVQGKRILIAICIAGLAG
jgi:hypothetical protein